MRWRNIAFMTVVLVFILSSLAASQDWVDIKDPKELLTLHSNKTFKYTVGQASAADYYRADGKGVFVSGESRTPFTWEVKGNDQVCLTGEKGTSCWRYQRSKKNPGEYVKRNVKDARMVVFKVEDGVPQF
jgi:hypothetical protein